MIPGTIPPFPPPLKPATPTSTTPILMPTPTIPAGYIPFNPVSGYKPSYQPQLPAGVQWITNSYATTFDGATPTVTAKFAAASTPLDAKTAQATLTELKFDLTPYTADAIVPASLLFSFLGRQYYDKSGTLYNQFDPTTGSGFPAGTIDYAQGVATITEWVAGAAPTGSVDAGLLKFGDFWVYESSFRTPEARCVRPRCISRSVPQTVASSTAHPTKTASSPALR